MARQLGGDDLSRIFAWPDGRAHIPSLVQILVDAEVAKLSAAGKLRVFARLAIALHAAGRAEPARDALAKAVGLCNHKAGATDPSERARLRAELDGLIAHLYGLTEIEFSHILATFPLVAEPIKVAAQNAYRDVERGIVR